MGAPLADKWWFFAIFAVGVREVEEGTVDQGPALSVSDCSVDCAFRPGGDVRAI